MKSRLPLIVLGFVAFIALGLPDALLGIAWPFMRLDLNLPLEANGLIVLAGTLGAALSGFVSSWLGRKLGIGRLLALSCLLTGFALIGYTLAPSLEAIIACAVVIGLSAGATDATVNGYVAKNFSDRLMQWLHASFGVGVTIGPAVMTYILVSDQHWSAGYNVHAAFQLLLALVFFVTAGLWLRTRTSQHTSATAHAADLHTTSMVTSLREIRIWLGSAMFFFYCGLEFSVGLWTFSLLTDVRGVSTAQAGIWVSTYWGMFTVGRIVIGLVANRLSNKFIMVLCFGLAVIGTAMFASSENLYVNLAALIAIGFAYAPMYPAMVSNTMARVGAKHFNNAMGIQVSGASLGIAIIPGSLGLIASQTTLAVYPWLLLVITGIFMAIYVLSVKLQVTSLSESVSELSQASKS